MAAPVFNFNVGVLGHVDSGKTSLSKALSTVASTASFDKNPQSQERGITLDLGFSSFQVNLPAHLTDQFGKNGGVVQYTLVDCPGHASLIKTIIGGSQIIDLMMLVVDVTKGLQTQTAECLVIGEITCSKMIVVLNKVDQLPAEKRVNTIDKMKKKMLKTLDTTKFTGCPIVAVAAKPGSEAVEKESIGLTDLIETLKANTYIPKRSVQGCFVFSVDHCFGIKGQGTVMTGTALSGSVSINDTIEIPSVKMTKKVKSIQMFKKPVEKIVQGDRAGVCVTQFDPKLLERGTICTPGSLPTIEAAIISVRKIPYYKGIIASKAKFHITTGHDTIMGKLTFFGLYGTNDSALEDGANNIKIEDEDSFDFSKEYLFLEELEMPNSGTVGDATTLPTNQFAFVEFEKPVTCQNAAVVIGSKLDSDIHANYCRIAFHGKLLYGMTDKKNVETDLVKLKVFKTKVKEGLVDRVMDEYTVIAKNLFKRETNIAKFIGLKVTLSTGEAGVIEGGFGQSGKMKARIPGGLPTATVQRYCTGKKKSKGNGSEASAFQREETLDKEPIKIMLEFKRFIFDTEKKMMQT